QSVDPVSERRRHAFRLGRVAIPNETVSCRCRWLCLSRGRLRQWFRRSGRLLPVARGWRGPAARFHYSPEHHDPGLSQPQKLLGVREPEPARRLERLGHIRDLPGGTDADPIGNETRDHEITKVVSRTCSLRECLRCRPACGLRGKMRAEMRTKPSGAVRVLINAQVSGFGLSGNLRLDQSITGFDPKRSCVALFLRCTYRLRGRTSAHTGASSATNAGTVADD